MAEKPADVALNIRLTPTLRGALKAEYWRTAPKHKLSFNAWVCGILERGFKEKKA